MMKEPNHSCEVCGAELPARRTKFCSGQCRKKCDRLRYKQRENRRRLYRLSDADYSRLKELQNGVCAICKGPPSGQGTDYHIDHDHQTLVVRGLLCHHCNCGLGHFRDSPELLTAAVTYLQAPTAAG